MCARVWVPVKARMARISVVAVLDSGPGDWDRAGSGRDNNNRPGPAILWDDAMTRHSAGQFKAAARSPRTRGKPHVLGLGLKCVQKEPEEMLGKKMRLELKRVLRAQNPGTTRHRSP